VPSPGHHVTYNVIDWDTRTDDVPPGAIAVAVTAVVFLISLPFIGLVRRKTEHRVTFEVDVRSVDQAPISSFPGPTGQVPRYEVKSITPHFRGRYTFRMTSGVNLVRDEIGNDRDRIDHDMDVISQAATRMVNASLADLDGAIRRYRGPPPMPPSPTGDELGGYPSGVPEPPQSRFRLEGSGEIR
jgi:hypothetical protein